ncbi:MAG: hypothetical protein ACPIEU_09485 [Candidatus Puniceispirillaceae bacterium]
MEHASGESLATIADLLRAIRNISGLRERKTEIFYRRGKAYLHFHESSDGELFADVRLSSDTEFERHNVSTKTSKEDFLALIEKDPEAG